MRETGEDLRELQALLDRSYAAAGPHLRDIITVDRRMSAVEVCAELTGMSLLVLATVTADGRPMCGPVDGVFHRGRFWFGSGPDSVRFRHIRARPQVSATYLPGEALAVTVHGRAAAVDILAPEHASAAACFREVYGEGWDEFAAPNPYARIDADRMFTFRMRGGSDGA